MACKYVTELLLSQHIMTRGEHCPHMLSTRPQLVSFKPQAFKEHFFKVYGQSIKRKSITNELNQIKKEF